MKQYLDLLQNVLDNGVESADRTGTGTIATFGEQIKFDLREGFPAMTTKKLAFRAMVSELIWFLKGSNDLYELRALLHGEEHRYNHDKRTIWDDNYYGQGADLGYDNGFMGDVYGTQWRNFGATNIIDYTREGSRNYIRGIDQVKAMLKEAESNPNSRRLLVTAWNPYLVWQEESAASDHDVRFPVLPPCHYGFQINIQGDYIDLLWTQRSVDVFLGLPFNIASYALLCHVFARLLCKTPRFLVGQLGNTHIYKNHLEQVKEQLSREPHKLPTLSIGGFKFDNIDEFASRARVDNFKLFNYNYEPAIKAPMAV